MPPGFTPPDLEEAARQSLQAYLSRDFGTAVAFFSPDAVWDGSLLGGAVFEGRAAIREMFEDWIGAYEEMAQEVEELRALGSGVTFGVVGQRARPAGSKGWLGFRYAAVAMWKDGLVVRQTIYPEADIDEARIAAEQLAKERG